MNGPDDSSPHSRWVVLMLGAAVAALDIAPDVLDIVGQGDATADAAVAVYLLLTEWLLRRSQ